MIIDHQFGFCERHSTIEHMHRIVNEIKSAHDEKNNSAIFLDVAQAFDKVRQEGLKHKIKKNPVIRYFFDFILESYQLHRQFQAKYNESTSILYESKAGDPQGRVLVPM